jgi:DNA polymerase III subunit alpha
VVSYQTAWLKANHPVEFMAAVMNCDIHLTDKLASTSEEVDRGWASRSCRPASTARSRPSRCATAVVYAPRRAEERGRRGDALIVEARGDRPFATCSTFARRVDLKRIGKRPLEMLARAGAFDALDPNRARVFEALDALVAWSAAVHEARASAQVSLFGEAGTTCPEPRLPFRDDWLPVERLAQEHRRSASTCRATRWTTTWAR